jgi:hypothetical protein
MKWILALVICFGETCQPGWVPTDKFVSKPECEMYATLYMEQAKKLYPDSQGQLMCIYENTLAEAKVNAEKEGFTIKPAPTLAQLNDYLEKHPPAPDVTQ